MRIEPFELERWQSIWENRVEVNLSESGVHPFTPRELLGDDAASLLDERLHYTQTNGTEALRARVAALHRGAGAEHVEVTNGGAEANFVALWEILEPGDEMIAQTPVYAQILGLARSLGATVKPWPLRADRATRRWVADLDVLPALVTPRTKLIAICNPNNPTGARLGARDLDAIAAVARDAGAWILSDEIYRGAELDGRETESMWGRAERVVVTGGLSKAYGLPGLRIGWIVGPPDFVDRCWGRHDYVTIAPSALSDRCARAALEPKRRAAILERTRRIVRENAEIVGAWIEERRGRVDGFLPEAGAVSFLRLPEDMDALALAERARVERSLLLVPGDHFGTPGHLRIGFGPPADVLREGLARLAALLEGPPAGPSR